MSTLSIEHMPGGFVVTHDGNRQIASSEMVASLIKRAWPEVAKHIVRMAPVSTLVDDGRPG